MLKKFFDYESPIWIRVYKIVVIVMTGLLILGSIIGSIVLAIEVYYYSGFEFTEFNFWIFISIFLGGLVTSFLFYVFNMVLLNFFYNTHSIKSILETKQQKD